MLAHHTRRTLGGILLFLGACFIALAAVSLQGIAVWGLTPQGAALMYGSMALAIGYMGVRFRRPLASLGFQTGHIVLYEAPMWNGVGRRTAPVTIRGARDAIERFIPCAEFGTLFDRMAVWRPSSHPVEELPGEALGVWGRRKCQRLRRLLRERGASLEVRREAGPPQSVASWSRSWGR